MQLDSYGNVVDYTTIIEGVRHLAITIPFFTPQTSSTNSSGVRPDVNGPVWQEGIASIERSTAAMERHFEELSQCMESIQSMASLSVAKVQVCVGAGVGEALAGVVPCTKNLNLVVLGSPAICKPELCGQSTCDSGWNNPDPQASLGRIADALRLCETVFSRDADSREQMDEVQHSVDQLCSLSVRLLDSEQTLEAQGVPLEVVQSMIRIQSARLDGEAKAALDALSLEIESVCTKLSQSIQRECTLVRLTRQLVGKMEQILKRVAGRRREAATRLQAAKRQILQLEQQGKEQSGQRQRLALVSRRIQDAVVGLVQGLQFQDIVSQRLSQIEDSLRQLIGTQQSSHNGQPDKAGHLPQQFQHASEEMNGALESIGLSLLQVEESEQMLHFQLKELLLDRRRRELKSQLQIAFDSARTLAKQSYEELNSLDKLIHPIVRNARNIGQELEGNGAQLRRTALNAQVQSARFGDETGLDVVVQSLSRVADEITNCSQQLGDCAAQLLNEAGGVRNTLASLQIDAAEIHAEGEQMLPKLQEDCTQNELSFRDSILVAISTLEHLSKERVRMERVLRGAQRPLRELAPLAHRLDLVFAPNVAEAEEAEAEKAEAEDLQASALASQMQV